MTLTRRGVIMAGLGLVLTVGLLGFAVTPAQALSISGTYTDIAFGSAGTGGAIVDAVQPGLVGGLGSSLVNGFPSTGTLGNNFWSIAQGTGISADGFGTRVDNASGPDTELPNELLRFGADRRCDEVPGGPLDGGVLEHDHGELLAGGG